MISYSRNSLGFLILCAVLSCWGCKRKDPKGSKTSASDRRGIPEPHEIICFQDPPFDPEGEGCRKPWDPLEVVPIYFEYDAYAIPNSQLPRLEENVATLKKMDSKYKFVIVGHADERGSTEYNFHLGERRAGTIEAYLIKAGVEASRLMIQSKGEEEPVNSAHEESAWEKNRRVELLMYD